MSSDEDEELASVMKADGLVRVRNPHLLLMDQDILYHLALGSGSHDLQEMFGDVKYVCLGGTPRRMKQFALYLMDELDLKLPTGTQLMDISQHSYRYSMYKVGPVLSVSHGMGMPSIGILLHELIKLMYHSKAKNPIFFRIGTCGGIGVDGGNLIVTTQAVDGELRPFYELTVLGKKVRRPAELDPDLVDELLELHHPDDPWQTHSGKTMCTDDFYEGQGRLDGAFCRFSEDHKMAFLQNVREEGVVNMEMESLAFAAHCQYAKIRAAVVCVTLLNRLHGDQIKVPKCEINEWQTRPQRLVARYIKKHLSADSAVSPENFVVHSCPKKKKAQPA
jgi:uridine phosphorylase